MADKKISELDAVSSAARTDEFVVVQSGTTKRAALSDIDAVAEIGASQVTAGTLDDDRVAESNVTQHGTAALEVPWSNTVVVEGDNSSRSTRATAVQSAITDAVAAGSAFVFVPHAFLDYDASAVTFDNSVRMVREGQVADVYDVKAYGAAGDDPGDGTGTDDFDAIDAALAALSDGDELRFPTGTFKTSLSTPPHTLSASFVTVSGGGVLLIAGNGDYDRAVDVTGDGCIWSVSIDQRQITDHSGRGEGVRLNGDYNTVKGHHWGEGDTRGGSPSFSNQVVVNGDDCRVEGNYEDAAYASIRHNGPAERLTIAARSMNAEVRGYTYNSSTTDTGSVIVEYFTADTDSTDPAGAGFLVDPAGSHMSSVDISYLEVTGTWQSNGVKLEYIRDVTIGTAVIDVPQATTGISLDGVTETFSAGKLIFLDGKFQVNDTAGVTADGYVGLLDNRTSSDADHFEFSANRPWKVNRAVSKNVGGSFGFLRFDPGANGRLEIGSLLFEAATGSGLVARWFAGDHGDLRIGTLEIITGNASLTSVAANDRKIVRAGVGEEEADAEEPQQATWQPGDIVDFTDTGDASGDGQYLLLRDGSTWTQLA